MNVRHSAATAAPAIITDTTAPASNPPTGNASLQQYPAMSPAIQGKSTQSNGAL
ncbi:hypothetical protein [Geminisphaera colitermitum]|uniref:hypothetical protein n=1 Tax=Geminisphaera colitermitum TaxID=1148786 RepID=UPI0002D5C610|nr:hypothetical protein [Geminisphaera colitermitum]